MKNIFITIMLFTLISCQPQGSLDWNQINSEIERKFSDVDHISLSEFVTETEDNEDVLIIDVRKKREFSVSHIPGAINITDAKEIAKLAKETDKDVIVYCSVGYRSAIVARELQNLGINEVANLQGSIFAWANQGLPLSNLTGITKEVHPYDKHWGQLLDKNVSKNYGH